MCGLFDNDIFERYILYCQNLYTLFLLTYVDIGLFYTLKIIDFNLLYNIRPVEGVTYFRNGSSFQTRVNLCKWTNKLICFERVRF